MRYLSLRKLQIGMLISLAVICVITGCSLPSSSQKGMDLSQEEALKLVLDEIVQPDRLGDDPLVIFAYHEVLVPGDLLKPYNNPGEDPNSGIVTIESESWFFWIEDEPYGQFAHPTRFVLVEIDNGEISSSGQRWWPVLNGQGLWTDAEEYQNEENWAWANVSFMDPEESSNKGATSVLSALLPSSVRPLENEGGTRKALVVNVFTEDQPGDDDGVEDAANMLRILEKTDFETTYLGTESDDNPKRSGVPFTEGGGKNTDENDPWRKWLRSQADEMKSGDTLVIYATGHSDGGGVGGSFLLNENGRLGSNELQDELEKFDPGVDIIVIVQSCKSGGFIWPLRDLADLTMTATDDEGTSYGDIDFAYSWLSLLNTDLNPLDDGSEYTSSLVSGWETILEDPELLEKVKQRAKDEGISFIDALISEAYREGSIYDLAARLNKSDPQEAFGSEKTKPKVTETPAHSPTPERSPTPSSGAVLGDYRVSMVVKKDKGGHKGFIGMWGSNTLTIKAGSIKIDGPFPWVSVSGELNEDGTVDASGRGTVAGYGNIKVTFQGSVSGGRLEGDYTMGANGGLPGGQAIVYGVSGDHQLPTATPTPDPRIGQLHEFFSIFNSRFQAADADGLIALLHPAVLDLYSLDACREYLATAVEKPVEIEVLQLVSDEPWTWEIDGVSTLIEDAYSIQVGVTAGGQTIQQSMHLGLLENGSITWFTDCGEPLQ